MAAPDLSSFFDARQNQLNLVMSAGDSIDAKALAILASNIAVLIFIGQAGLHKSAWVTMMVIMLVVSLVLTVIAIWPRRYAGASASMFEHPEYLQYGKTKLLKHLIADTEAAIRKNNAINRFRWIVCAVSLALSATASLLLAFLL